MRPSRRVAHVSSNASRENTGGEVKAEDETSRADRETEENLAASCPGFFSPLIADISSFLSLEVSLSFSFISLKRPLALPIRAKELGGR